jgi:type IV secretory pathway VirB10-like protein
MFSKPLAFGLLALGCLTAAAGGAYLATRHNTAETLTGTQPAASVSAPSSDPAAQPVTETEAPVAAEKPAPEAPSPSTASEPQTESRKATVPATPTRRTGDEKAAKPSRPAPSPSVPVASKRTSTHDGTTASTSPAPAPALPAAPTSTSASIDLPSKPVETTPERHVPQFEEVVLPAASVIGLQVETALSSERARIEDRVEARVTRDVMANGRVAIPAGSRVLGSVTLVDKGGKMKDRARLGIRFHTVVLADGTDLALNTEPIYRDGESPAGDSAKKIGGAAIGGAILGAILGGGKGAVIGGGTGAAGGTAVVMAGDRNPATIAPGSVVTVRLSSPVTIQVEKRELQ